MFRDERDHVNRLQGRTIRLPRDKTSAMYDQHDGDRARSRALGKARFARKREVEAEMGQSLTAHHFFDDRRVRFDPALLSERSFFYGPPSQCKIHYDHLTDYAREHSFTPNGKIYRSEGGYRLVSQEWKAAIESLEPGVHEFFPHEVEFSNWTITDHFIFRDCLELSFIDLERSQPTAVERLSSGQYAGKLLMQDDPVGLAVRKEVVAGRHWIRDIDAHPPFVSRALALKLLPILPEALDRPEPFVFRPVLLV